MPVLPLFSTFYPSFHLHQLLINANEGDASHSKGSPLKQVHDMMRNRAIVELQQVRKLIRDLEQVKGFEHRNHYHKGYDVNPINAAYSFSHENYDDKEREARRRRHLRGGSKS